MKLADSSQQQLEAFFREYLDDASFRLPALRFYAGKYTKILTNLISVHGITFGKRIFITPKLLSFNRDNFLKLPEDLIAHEISHVLQYKREGSIKFLYEYTMSFWRNLRKKKNWNAAARHEAYLEIPFEIEARQTAANFVEWNKTRDKR